MPSVFTHAIHQVAIKIINKARLTDVVCAFSPLPTQLVSSNLV